MQSFKLTGLALLTVSVVFVAFAGIADDSKKSDDPEPKPLVNSPLKKGSDPLEGVEKQGKTGRPERVRPLFQRTVKSKPLTKEEKAVAQEALGAFNSFIGGWRGAGQVRRGSRAGAWQEDGIFVWNFDDGGVAIQYDIKKGKHIRTALVTWDPKAKAFRMNAAFADKIQREYTGKFEKNVLVLESKPDAKDYVSRVTMRQLNEKRMLVLYETRKASQSFYRRLGEVGYTREGTRLASSDSTGPECVVSGGAGTIAVSYKGKKYFVCCTGCRDAFNDDPEGILADYKARLEERKKKKS